MTTKREPASNAASRKFRQARNHIPQTAAEIKQMALNVLVTGGAGYIGSVVSNELLKAGHRVTVYDNLSHGYSEAVPQSAELIVGDLADAKLLNSALSRGKFDAVMHFAALIEAGESMQVPGRYFEN